MLLAPLSQPRGGMVSAGTVCFMKTIRMEGKDTPLVCLCPLDSEKMKGQERILSSLLAWSCSGQPGKTPRAMWSVSRGGARIGRKRMMFL